MNRKTAKPLATHGATDTPLPESMTTGKASAAKAAAASLPPPQRGIAECIDRLAAAALPDWSAGEVGHGLLRRGNGMA